MLKKRHLLVPLAILVSLVIAGQLVVQTAWTADQANAGPTIAILQLSNDKDTDWAVNDLLGRLRSFVFDDLFIQDRIRVVKTSNSHVAESLDNDIVVYMSHGGPLGIVTGSRLTSWKTMAGIVTDSPASLHLFAACASRNIIRYGDENSGKQLYTVPGSRPAEVTNVEITSTIMLALGLDSDWVEEYRIDQLTRARELVQSSTSVHIMDFEQIILDEIEAIEETYNSTYTEDFKVYRVSNCSYYSLANFTDLPYDLLSLISYYYGTGYDPDEGGYPRNLLSVNTNYVKNYYINSTYVIDGGGLSLLLGAENSVSSASEFSEAYFDAAAATLGHWENSTPVFTGGTYSGYFKYDNIPTVQCSWTFIMVNVTASGAVKDEVDSIHLEQLDVGGVRVDRAKVDGVWQEAVADRVPGRTGGLWIDAATSCEYEYNPMWPNEGGTMLASWQYRKSHLILGTGYSGTGCTIRIIVSYLPGTDSGDTVYVNGRCQTDFDDIRFTSDDGNTLLDYWREWYTASVAAVFWVEIADPIANDAIIYMYYGNPSVSSASNLAATFIQYDDFNDGVISPLWAQGAGYGSITETGGSLKLSVSSSANGDWWGGTAHYAPIVWTNAPVDRFAAVVKLKSYTVNTFTHAGIMVYEDRDNAYLFGRYRSDTYNGYRVEKIIDDIGYNNIASYQSTALDTLLRIRYFRGISYFDLSLDGGIVWTNVASESDLRPTYIGLFAKEWMSSSIDALFDDWSIRKIAGSDPVQSTWGAEEYMNLDAWGYRKLHTITGSSGAGTNYQVRIVANYGTGTDSGGSVYCNSHCQTDFDDIRFTDATGSVLLDHWRESYTASSQAFFWVEVSGNLDSTQNIYMYYGNPSASSASNGFATFIQFDDFNDNVVSGSWTQSKPVGTITEQWSSSMVISIGSAVDGNWWGGTTEYAPIAYRASPTGGYAAVTKLNTYTVNVNTHAGIMAYTNRDNAYLFGRYRDASYNEYRIEKIISNVGYNRVSYYSSTQMGMELRIREVGSTRYYEISSNGGSSWSSVYSTTQLDPAYLGLFAKEWGSNTIDAVFDFWYVRKCISSEPAHGSWANEEAFASAGQGTIQTTGEYLYVSSIPTGTGWHGPTFLQTLPSYFGLEDFGLLSANLSLLHGGQIGRMGSVTLFLYDDMKRPVLAIGVADAWGSYSDYQTSTIFYTASGTSYDYPWSRTSGDFNGILSIRLDPSLGLLVKVSGQSEHQLIGNPLLVDNPDRTIKYVGIDCNRYSTYAEHDERIYSFKVSYCRSEFTSFYDACLTNSSFRQDDAFGVCDTKEDAEDGDIAFWEVYDDTPAGTVSNVPMGGDRAICLQGGGQETGYRYPDSANFWNERNRFVIQWSMNYTESYTVYISVDTTAGHRYLYYTAVGYDSLGTGENVHHGLGTASYDGRWHTFQRDLVVDLHEAQPTVNIVDINAFLIRGSGYVDDIKLLSYATVKEDAEDGRITGWGVASGDGYIMNTLLDDRRVIQLEGSGTSTGYKYPYASANYWNDKDHLMIQWSMKYSEDFIVYVSVDTSSGSRSLWYTPVDYDDLGTGEFVHHGIGSNSTDGTWRTFARDLLADLHDAQPSVDIIDVNYFLVHGSGYVDEILLLTTNSDADLTVPAGTSYLTTSITARSAVEGWHGPTFVRPLDRPFRLYQLGEFSVHAALIQAANRMGQTYVGLFDSQMKCVFWIYFGDSWASTQKGYIHTGYYSEDGGAYYQSATDIATSFDKTAALWYDRNSDSIRSAIDGNVVTLGPVYNASRIVSYLVIVTQAYEYGGVSLLDMRIHEISVLASVRATPPWMPELPEDEEPLPQEYDGTDDGSAEAFVFGQGASILAPAALRLMIKWIGPWPEIEFSFVREAPDDPEFVVRRDILRRTTVHAMCIPNLDEDFWDEATETFCEAVFYAHISLMVILANLAEYLAIPNPVAATAILYSLPLYVALIWGYAMVYLNVGVSSGAFPPGEAKAKLLQFAVWTMLAAFGLNVTWLISVGAGILAIETGAAAALTLTRVLTTTSTLAAVMLFFLGCFLFGAFLLWDFEWVLR